MNDTTQTIVRSVLKVGSGYLVAKGIIDESGAEVLIASIIGIASVIWGIYHRKTK